MKNMKKILIGVTVMAIFATGCQSERLIESDEIQKGELFTLEVGKGFGSRTVLSGTATHWCEDDAIYVSGANGDVSGVLTFRDYVGNDKSKAVFSGYVFGGQPSELEHIVFPVPQDGKIDMSARKEGRLDAPMLGTIGDGAVQTLNNVGGLLAVMIKNESDKELTLTAKTSNGENMTGGYYTFSNGKLKYTPEDTPISIQAAKNGYTYIPVATTTNATNGTEANQSVEVEVTILDTETEDEVSSTDTQITVSKGEIFGDDDEEETGLDVSLKEEGTPVEIIKVATLEELKSVAEEAEGDVNIMLTDNIVMGNETEKCNALQFNEKVTSLTIYGNNKSITFKGKAAHRNTNIESVAGILSSGDITVKNVTLVNDKLSYFGTGISADRLQVYTTIRGASVTYEGVTFDGGVQVKGNETFIGCKFTEELLIDDEDGYAKNGRFCMFIDHEYGEGEFTVNLDGCTFDARGYGCVKVAGDGGANITVNVKGCTFYNTCPSNSSTSGPKWDIKKTGTNITVNDKGGNTWSSGRNGGIGEG